MPTCAEAALGISSMSLPIKTLEIRERKLIKVPNPLLKQPRSLAQKRLRVPRQRQLAKPSTGNTGERWQATQVTASSSRSGLSGAVARPADPRNRDSPARSLDGWRWLEDSGRAARAALSSAPRSRLPKAVRVMVNLDHVLNIRDEHPVGRQ
jgi:hypothetical protein